MFSLPAASILVVSALPGLLAPPCDNGTDSFSADISHSMTCHGLLPDTLWCEEETPANKDTEFLHMIQDDAHVLRRRTGVSPKTNSSDRTWSNTKPFMMLCQFAKFFGDEFSFRMQQSSTTLILITLAFIATIVAFCIIRFIVERSWNSSIPVAVRAVPNKNPARVKGFAAAPSASSQDSDNKECIVECAPLPVLCPQFILSKPIRLAIPIEPLRTDVFVVDVLAMSGIPLITASLPVGMSNLEVTLNRSGALLALVTPSRQILSPDNQVIGTVLRIRAKHYTMRNPSGQDIMFMEPGNEFQEVRMVTTKTNKECAKVHRQVRNADSDEFSVEHYILSVMPGVDSVFVFSCFLALIFFVLPSHSPEPETAESYPTSMLSSFGAEDI